jgi:hypothetical protein
VHFTPTSAAWLNMVESSFSDLTVNRLRRGMFRHLEELVMAVGDYNVRQNLNPKPPSMLRAILLNMVSTMLSHEPCLGVKTTRTTEDAGSVSLESFSRRALSGCREEGES